MSSYGCLGNDIFSEDFQQIAVRKPMRNTCQVSFLLKGSSCIVNIKMMYWFTETKLLCLDYIIV